MTLKNWGELLCLEYQNSILFKSSGDVIIEFKLNRAKGFKNSNLKVSIDYSFLSYQTLNFEKGYFKNLEYKSIKENSFRVMEVDYFDIADNVSKKHSLSKLNRDSERVHNILKVQVSEFDIFLMNSKPEDILKIIRNQVSFSGFDWAWYNPKSTMIYYLFLSRLIENHNAWTALEKLPKFRLEYCEKVISNFSSYSLGYFIESIDDFPIFIST